jgi:hypothetical protein
VCARRSGSARRESDLLRSLLRRGKSPGNLQGPGGRPLPGLATVAIQQARHVAQGISRGGAGASSPFKYFDKGALAVIGRGRAVCEVRGLKLSGRAALAMYLGVHLYYLGGAPGHRVKVLADWTSVRIGDRQAPLIEGDLASVERTAPDAVVNDDLLLGLGLGLVVVGNARDRDVVPEVGVARDEVVRVHPDVAEQRLELVQQPALGLLVGRLVDPEIGQPRRRGDRGAIGAARRLDLELLRNLRPARPSRAR